MPRALATAPGAPSPVPARVERVFPGGTTGGNLALHARARASARLAAHQPAGGARIPAARRRRRGRRWAGITGRGNTANLEVVLALKPDLILDVGSDRPTYVSLAERVQQQTGIPYALLDGRFDGISPAYRTLGALIGRHAQGEALRTLRRGHDARRSRGASPPSRRKRGRGSITPAARAGSRPGSAARSTWRRSS